MANTVISCMCSLLCDSFFCKQKTAYEMRISDWSSDVCSSDLRVGRRREVQVADTDMQVSGTDGQRESRLVTDAFDVLELDPGRTAGLAHDRVRGLLAAGVEFGCSLFLDIGLDTIEVRA